MAQKKLVQSFKTFFQKSVTPYVSQNPQVMRQWSQLSKIISSDPIDYSQIQYYLYKNNGSPDLHTSQQISESPRKNAENTVNRYNTFSFSNQRNNDKGIFQKKNSLPVTYASKKQQSLYIERIQSLAQNISKKLQNIIKKQNNIPANQTPINIIPNSPTLRKY